MAIFRGLIRPSQMTILRQAQLMTTLCLSWKLFQKDWAYRSDILMDKT